MSFFNIPVNKCVECESSENIVKHHIIPESRGGKFVVPLCQLCHDKVHDLNGRNISMSKLTLEGLNKARMRGVKLGNPRPAKAIKSMCKFNKEKKIKFANKIMPIIKEIQSASNNKITLQGICDELLKRNILTRHGKQWNPTTVRNLKISYMNQNL